MNHDQLADRLATKLAGALVNSLNERKDQVLGGLGPVARAGARLAWNPLMAAVPFTAAAGLDALLDEFGSLSVRDVMEFLADHSEKKGDRAAAWKFRTGR